MAMTDLSANELDARIEEEAATSLDYTSPVSIDAIFQSRDTRAYDVISALADMIKSGLTIGKHRVSISYLADMSSHYEHQKTTPQYVAKIFSRGIKIDKRSTTVKYGNQRLKLPYSIAIQELYGSLFKVSEDEKYITRIQQ